MNRYLLFNILLLLSYLPDFLFWSSITYYRNIRNRDIKILKNNYFLNVSAWEILHFISYLIKGLFFGKKYFIYFIGFGFIFEFIELFIQANSKYLNIKFVNSKIITNTIVNSFGYIVGVTLLSLMFKNKPFIKFFY